MDATAEKKALRRQMKLAKQSLTADDKRAAGERLIATLDRDESVRTSRNIVAYWSLDDELPTHALVEHLRQTKNVYLPVIVGDGLELRRFCGSESLESEQRFGIGEPTNGEQLPEDAASVVILVPGIAFTADGKRLGRGGGFYDRMLQQQSKAVKIGVAFACQRVDDLPTEAHDRRMDKVYFL